MQKSHRRAARAGEVPGRHGQFPKFAEEAGGMMGDSLPSASANSGARKRPLPPGIKNAKLTAAYADAQRFLRRDYVTGVGIGYVMKRGQYTKQIAISIHVEAKLD